MVEISINAISALERLDRTVELQLQCQHVVILENHHRERAITTMMGDSDERSRKKANILH